MRKAYGVSWGAETLTIIDSNGWDSLLNSRELFLKPERERVGNDKGNSDFYVVLFFPPFSVLFSPKSWMCGIFNMKVELLIYACICASYSLTSEGHFHKSYIKSPWSYILPRLEIRCVLHLPFRQKDPFTYPSLKNGMCSVQQSEHWKPDVVCE